MSSNIETLNKIIELKEAERMEWAKMCIGKQKQIDGLKKDIDMAVEREVAMLTDFGYISENISLGNITEAKKIADDNHSRRPPESVVKWYTSKMLIIILSLSFSSCAQYYCKPTPRSKDWAVINTGHHFIRVQEADCGWLVTERIGFKTTTRVYECLPDSLKEKS